MLRRALYAADFTRRGVRPHWRGLDAFPRLGVAARRRRMGELLLEQVRYFGTREDSLPEWREAARCADPEALWEMWPSLPVVTKRDLQTRFHPRELVARGVVGSPSSTGGSTGEPTPFLHDPAMLSAGAAALFYSRRKMGWRPGMPVVAVWGSERDIGKYQSWQRKAIAGLQNLHMVDGYVLDQRTVDRVLDLLARVRGAAVYGFTSMLEYVAREALKRGDERVAGRVRAAWNGGEMLFPEQSALFQAAFGVPILNFYGGRELSAMAYQPGAGLPLRVLRPLLFVEVVDDGGRAVPPGVPGRLLWTSTVCRGTPFLRYDVGDLGVYDEAGRDESGIHTLAELQGREAGLVKLGDGRTINCLYWNHLFKEFPEVEQFQVAWKSAEPRMELRLRGTPFGDGREADLRRIARLVLGDTPLSVKWMERIPLTAQGKLLQVVRE
ncbi:MAG TPA: AMP-binding protein [Longimicrobium sp.]|nr:AMP-binding protein [Longimicrobium sp.]